MENGVGLRHIQTLLGHSKPETTMIYTHVMRKDLINIKSPLDKAVEQLKQTDKLEQKFLLSGK
jgi:integrase